MAEQRNDGQSNFQGALIVAGHYTIPEVTLFFDNKLLRGNRATKVHASGVYCPQRVCVPWLHAIYAMHLCEIWLTVFAKCIHSTARSNRSLSVPYAKSKTRMAFDSTFYVTQRVEVYVTWSSASDVTRPMLRPLTTQ